VRATCEALTEISPEEPGPTAKNNGSLVVRLRYGERSILLPGDAEIEVEYAMMAEDGAETLHADMLKIWHHASKNSWMPEFLAAVGTQVGITSAGEQNPYGILVQYCCRDWK
jgi:competence protein ComEC